MRDVKEVEHVGEELFGGRKQLRASKSTAVSDCSRLEATCELCDVTQYVLKRVGRAHLGGHGNLLPVVTVGGARLGPKLDLVAQHRVTFE